MPRNIIGRLISRKLALSPRAGHAARTKPKATFRPCLEVLEGRLTPSTFIVTSTSDMLLGTGLGGTLRYCITQANINAGTNTIQFDPNVFGTPQTITLTSRLPVITDNNLTIAGPGASLATVSGNHLFQVMNITAANASLSGLTIANGSSNIGPTIGGGIYFGGAGTLAVSNTVISNNYAPTSGGGIFLGSNSSATLALANTVISGNVTNGRGGGIYSSSSPGGDTVTLTNCTVSGNSAKGGRNGGAVNMGGGILNGGILTATDSTLSNNFAYHSGGAVFNFGTATLTNCTVSGNSVTTGFGGAMNSGSGLTLNNTLVAGNTAATGNGPDIQGSVTSTSGFNLIGNGSGVSGITNGTNGNQVGTSTNPIKALLASLGNYGGPTQTQALLPGSPALDAGSNALDGGATTDQRGDPRVVNGTVDIGAFESQGFTVTITGGNNQSTRVNTAFASALAVAVSSIAGEPVAGGVVKFTPPSSGASAALSATSVTLNGSGQASVTATANNVAGSYTVSVSAGGANAQANFNLTNLAGANMPQIPPSTVVGSTPAQGRPVGTDEFGLIDGYTQAVAPILSSNMLGGLDEAIDALSWSSGDGNHADAIDALFGQLALI